MQYNIWNKNSAKAMHDNLNSPLLKSAIEYYVRYEKLPLEIKKRIKKEVMKEFWLHKNI